MRLTSPLRIRRRRVTATAPGPDSDDPDLAETVVFTSGTTGLPKGALFKGKQIAAIAAFDTGGAWGTGGPQLVATGLPHIGFMTKLAGYFQLGATLHILDRWRAADALRVLANERVPFIGGVAAQVSLLMHHPDFPSYDWSAVKGLIIGAGPSPAALVREARERFGGAGYSVRYSLTESGGVGTLTAFDAPESETLGSVGRPRPGTDLEIRDPGHGRALGPDEIGRVCLRSPAVMAGYWRDPEAPAAALDPEGWLRTGDLGYVAADGLLRITGRIGEMYIRGGYNVFPLEVESVLLEHPAVASVADRTPGQLGDGRDRRRHRRAAIRIRAQPDSGGPARVRRREAGRLQAARGDAASSTRFHSPAWTSSTARHSRRSRPKPSRRANSQIATSTPAPTDSGYISKEVRPDSPLGHVALTVHSCDATPLYQALIGAAPSGRGHRPLAARGLVAACRHPPRD